MVFCQSWNFVICGRKSLGLRMGRVAGEKDGRTAGEKDGQTVGEKDGQAADEKTACSGCFRFVFHPVRRARAVLGYQHR